MTKPKPLKTPTSNGTDDHQLRRGPWTLEEDNLLIQCISSHGEGRWNSLALFSGLKRTGKSCRLRWLNYLKPDIKRGNLTPHEQLMILELHSRWGNRWSKIAQNLPGRTDNEIKNYWRTRVQKQARQLKIDCNSNKFVEAIRTFWMPRLIEKMEQESSCITSYSSSSSPSDSSMENHNKLKAPNPSALFNHVPNPSSIPQPVNDVDYSNNMFLVNNSLEIPGYLTPHQDCDSKNGKQLEKDCFYHVEAQMQQELDQEAQQDAFGLSGCHLSDADWFGEELGNIIWNNDEEFWQLKKPEDVGI